MTFRNPQERMGLKTARDLLADFVSPHEQKVQEKKKQAPKRTGRKISQPQTFRSSYLDGK